MRPKRKNLHSKTQGDKLVIMKLHSLYVFGNKEKQIWNLCDGKHTIKEIEDYLFNKYPDVDKNKIKSELNLFIKKLRKSGLLE